MNTTQRFEVECQNDECGQVHEAEFSHLSQFGGHRVYATVCTTDYLTDYYTDEIVRPVAS